MLIMAFDPGITTGIAVNLSEYTNSHEVVGSLSRIWFHLNDVNPSVIVYEDFVYQRRTKVVLYPVEVIGVIKLYAETKEIPIYHHTAGTVMRFMSDDKLRAMGLYKPGQPHANDAMRHLMYHLIVTKKETKWLEKVRPE